MNIQQAKQIQLIDLLHTLGYKPRHTTSRGNEVWYCSPLRKERTPSFSVKVSDNCWKDFGGSGGNILDFVMQHENTDLRGALAFLDGQYGSLISASAVIRQVRKSNKDSSIILDKVKPLQYPALLQQLEEKGITASLAKLHLEEAYYTNGGKRYFGYCMKNDVGGYEIHNKYFKGATGGKAATTLKGVDSKRVAIFEGMTDFLSALAYYNILAFQTDTIVLHSLAFLTSVIEKINTSGQYNTAYLYLDNDEAGEQHLALFQRELQDVLKIQPMNEFYKNYKDVNEFWLAAKRSRSSPSP